MSRQLAVSSAFSIFTMAAFALFATSGGGDSLRGALAAERIAPERIAGAPIAIEAPANLVQRPKLPALPLLSD